MSRERIDAAYWWRRRENLIQLPHSLVLDGELVVWDTEAGRLSFEALQRRAAIRARGAAGFVARWPACFVAFDLLQQDGQELLTRPYAERRALLENLFSEHALTAPWALCRRRWTWPRRGNGWSPGRTCRAWRVWWSSP
ncbi:hypothetical protein ACIQK6_41125 [Streptomyces sp. NPDC091682]|uniref:ATP-dependent DNA ligase n=1 Tax=Streptomyces sp. NPDC091682 TaxID=3366005 RepID=UPI003806B7AC